jgi:putative transposase
MIEKEHPLPITKQCTLLQLSRSSVYYEPVPLSDEDRELMRLIDEIHLEEPYLGSRGIKNILKMRGHTVGRIHVRTCMRMMGIEAVYKKPRLSQPHPGHTVYPYLLRGLDITEANAVWCSDITYIPMARGFCYLVAVMDWASRKILSWRLSNTLDPSFCVEALEEAIARYGRPQIFNTDQGIQFTADAFIQVLTDHHIRISMDGRGRWRDNIVIERFWKTVKYEEVYLKAYESLTHARKELKNFFERYNMRRPHQGLDDRTPDAVYWSTLPNERNAA